MNTKTLILVIAGIGVISASAYFIVSPMATRTLDKQFEEEMKEYALEDVSTSTAESEEVAEEQVKESVVSKTSTTEAPTNTTQPEPVEASPVESGSTGYTKAEVALHADASSCWSIINSTVYDLTSYVSKHPGGSRNILKICGRDGTSAFEGEHGGESRPEKILAGYEIGILK